MERDMELIREILLAVEESQTDPLATVPLKIEGYDDTKISYHVWLCVDARLVEGVDCSTMQGFSWEAQRLTWNGHEFLQAIRDETIWNKVKRKLLKPSASWTFPILMEYLKLEITKKLGME